MTDRDVFRNIARLACKMQNRKLYFWCVRMNQKSAHRSWGWKKAN